MKNILVFEKHTSQEMILYIFLYSIKLLYLCDPEVIGKDFFTCKTLRKLRFKTSYFLFYLSQRRE